MRAIPSWIRRNFQIWAIALRGTFFPLVLICAGFIVCSSACAQAPDNAAANRPGNAPDANRADQQGFGSTDREMTRKIRKSIIADKSLSTYAHNVKIISRNGVVTLKGPVRSDDEKKAIESAASQIAGAANVKDELTVKLKE